MQIISYSFKLWLVIKHVELLHVLIAFVQMTNVVSDGTDLVVDELAPKVLLQIL